MVRNSNLAINGLNAMVIVYDHHLIRLFWSQIRLDKKWSNFKIYKKSKVNTRLKCNFSTQVLIELRVSSINLVGTVMVITRPSPKLRGRKSRYNSLFCLQ